MSGGIRECPQEPVDVAGWRKAMEGVTSGEWSARGRLISAVGGVGTFSGPVHGTIIVCDETWQSDAEGRYWSTSGDPERNAAWVARCSPAEVSKLVDALEDARERASAWAADFGRKCSEHAHALRRIEELEGSGRTLADAPSNPHPTGEKEGRS